MPSTGSTCIPVCVLENIFSYLSGNTLRNCKTVCKLWLVSADNVFRHREYAVSLNVLSKELEPDTAESGQSIQKQRASRLKQSFITLKEKINKVQIDLYSIILFCSCTAELPAGLQTYQLMGNKLLPHPVANSGSIVGCDGLFFIDENSDELEFVAGFPIQSSTVYSTLSLQCLLLPKISTYQVEKFYIPLRKKYESIAGISSFLPVIPEDSGKLIILFAHPLSLGRLTSFVKAARSKYSTDVCIVGSFADKFVFLDKLVTHGEIVGWVFTGSVIASSIVISCTSDKRHSYSTIKKFANDAFSRDRNENHNLRKPMKFLLIFSAKSGIHSDLRLSWIVSDLKRFFPNVPISGICSKAAFGCFHNIPSADFNQLAGGRDYLQTNSIVVCYVSIDKSIGPQKLDF